MKLHIPLRLRLTLLASLSATLTLLTPLQADQITLSGEVVWDASGTPGYTGVVGDWYQVDSECVWNLDSGNYVVSIRPDSSDSALTAINLASFSTLTNRAHLSASTVSSADVGEVQGICLRSFGELHNEAGATLTSHAENTDTPAHGIGLGYNALLSNAGSLTATASGGEESCGLFFSGGKLSNKETGNLTALGAYGIYLSNQASLTNSGTLSAGSNLEGSGCGIYLTYESKLTNDVGGILNISGEDGANAPSIGIQLTEGATLENKGTLNVQTGESEDSRGIWLEYGSDSTLINSGTLTVKVSGTDSNGILLESGSTTLTNSGTLTATASGAGSCGIYVMYASLNNEQGGSISATGSLVGIYIQSDMSNMSNYGAVNATSTAMGGYGMYLGRVGLNNEASGSITAEGSVGLEVTMSSTLNNRGSIQAEGNGSALDREDTSHYLSGYAYGLQVTASSTINNYGSVEARGTLEPNLRGEDRACGIYVDGATLNNLAGTLTAIATDTCAAAGPACQGHWVSGIRLENDAKLTNTAMLTATASDGSDASCGIWLEGYMGGYFGEDPTLANSGNITASATGENQNYGIYLNGASTLTNQGYMGLSAQDGYQNYVVYLTDEAILRNDSGTMEADATGYTAHGLHLCDSSTLTNKGSLDTEGVMHRGTMSFSASGMDESYGIYVYETTLDNKAGGTLTGYAESEYGRAHGIHLDYESTLNNAGTLLGEASGSEESRGISLGGAELNNAPEEILTPEYEATGQMSEAKLTGVGAYGIYFEYTSTLSNSGQLFAASNREGEGCGILLDYNSVLNNNAGGSLTTAAEGYYAPTVGIHLINGAALNNRGTLNAQTNGSEQSCGIWLEYSGLSNDGEVTATASGAESCGIRLAGAVLHNGEGYGEVIGMLTVEGAVGIELTEGGYLYNDNGTASATGIGEEGCAFRLSNIARIYNRENGHIDATGALGFDLTDSYLENQGTIVATPTGAEGYAFRLNGSEFLNETGSSITVVGSRGFDITGQLQTNKGSISITGSGAARGSIRMKDAQLENSGSIEIQATGAGETPQEQLYGIFLQNSELYNQEGGSLKVTMDLGNRRVENVSAIYLNYFISNESQMEVSLNGGENSCGLLAGGTKALTLENEATGTLTVLVNQGGEVTSTTAQGIQLANFSDLTNHGQLTAAVSATSEACGISLDFSRMLNEAGGKMSVCATAGSEGEGASTAYGIKLDSSTLTNRGELSISTHAAGGEAYGIYLNESELANSGTLYTDSVWAGGYNSYLCLNNGSTTGALTEGGTLSVLGGHLQLGGKRAEDESTSNSIVTISSDFSFSGVELLLWENTTLLMSGDLSIAEGVTHVWFDNTLTVDNGGSMHTVSIGGMTLTLDSTVSFTETEGKVAIVGNTTVNNGSVQSSGELNMGSKEERSVLTSSTPTLSVSAAQGGTMTNTTLKAEEVVVSGGEAADLTLDSVDVVATGGSIELENVVVSGMSSFTSSEDGTQDSPLNALFTNVTFILTAENSPEVEILQALSQDADNVKLTLLHTSALDDATQDALLISPTALMNMNIDGSLTFDLLSYADYITANSYETVGIVLGDNTTIAATTNVTATLNGTATASPYSVENGTLYFSVAQMNGAVPEPSTATLSLLALVAIATRRRR